MEPRSGTPANGVPLVGGRYAFVRRIARGGGGTVWEAHDDMLDRTVAVKEVEIPDELSDDERDRLRRRVLAEARAAARLEHPAVVVVHDVLDSDDRVHLVMEYVEAPTLRRLVDEQGPLDEQVVAAVGYGLLDVLAEAHRRGVVHRDVKPSNVFVLDDGSVKLGDFGIAALTGEVSLTRTGVALGSPSYLAPEQARGETAAPPADLWGLGATLYYAVEGRPPFDRRTALATVHAVVNEPMRAFERADGLQGVLSALLSKDPSRRPSLAMVRTQLATVAGLPSAVREASAPDPSPPPRTDEAPPSTEVPAAGQAGDRRWGRWIAAALALVAMVVAAALLTGGDPPGEDAPLAEGETDGAPDEPGEATSPTGAPTGDATPEDEPDTDADTDGGDTDGGDTDGDEAATDAGTDGDDSAGDAADDAQGEPSGTADGGEGGADGGAGAAGAYVVPETAAPDGWQVVEGETYRVAVPAGWQRREVEGNRTDWVDPDTGAYLRIDWTDDPADDPVADWERAEQGFAQRYGDYERVRLDPATYRDWEAAMWEYTYTAGGTDLRAINLNVLADDLGHAFALNLQAPRARWERTAEQFPAMAGSFEPTVGG